MIESGTCIGPAERTAWLDERNTGIGSSEAAAVVGVSKYETPLSLYLRKLGLTPPVLENAAMRWGTRLEPVVADAYREATGCDYIAEQMFVRCAAHPFMLATIDRIRDDGRIVEIKTAGNRSADQWGEPGTDEIPQAYLVQVHHQMIAAEIDTADVAVLIGGQEFRTYTVRYHSKIADEIVWREEEFWNCVQNRQPPEIQEGRDAESLLALWPTAEGLIDFDETWSELVRLWEVQGRMGRDMEEERGKTKEKLLIALKDSAGARLTDGRVLTRKVVEVAETQITRKSYQYVDLRLRKGR